MSDDGPVVPAEPVEKSWPPHRPDGFGYYILWHWRGLLPLGMSFWFNIVVLNLVLRLCNWIFLGIAAEMTGYLSVLAAIVVFQSVAIWPVWLWQLVGAWRSAVNHSKHTGRDFWAGFTLTVLSVTTLYGLYTVPAQYRGLDVYGRLALGDDWMADYTVTAGEDDTLLVLTGSIGMGLSGEVEEYLDSHPSVTTVVLNIQGGRRSEARALRWLISKRRLNTMTTTLCSQACAVAFIGGEKRTLGPEARIEFKRYSPDDLFGADGRDEERSDTHAFAKAGVDEAFLRKVFSMPTYRFWSPGAQELLDAGFVTDAIPPLHVEPEPEPEKAPSSGNLVFQMLESALLETPLFAAIRGHRPERYREIMGDLRDSLDSGAGIPEAMERTKTKMQKLVDEAIWSASDVAVNELIVARRGLLVEMRTVSPSACYDYSLGGGAFMGESATDAIKAKQNRVIEVLAGLFSPSGELGHPHNRDEAETRFADVIARVKEKHGDKASALFQPAASETEKAAGCDMAIAMHDAALEMPPPDSAQAFRYRLAY